MSVRWSDRGLSLAARGAASASALMRGPRLSTLIFHRVLREPDAMFPLEMHAAQFERIMRVVARAFHVLPLQEAVSLLARNELPPRALAITFDDGYADNHDVAMPILRALGLPATVFVATAFVDGGLMWNDWAIECVRRTARERLDLSELGQGVMPCVTASERRAVVERVLPVIKYRPPAEREPLLKHLHALCGSPALPDDLMMSSAQVRALPAHGLSIGAHTRHHPILRTLPDAEAMQEIGQSKAWLEACIDAPVPLFAYPNGRPGQDYDERHAAMARSLGFEAAVSTRSGVAKAGDDLFQLPRYTPWELGLWRWSAQLVRHHATH